jgi:DNA-binding transcriptional LysR family regulator
MRPDIHALEALDAVIRHGGVAHAAARLHKAQSAVSYQIRKLEQQLGIPILDRSGYRVRLTPAGEAVLAEARPLIAQAAHIASIAQQFAAGCEPRLTLVVDGILPLEWILRALKELSDERVSTRIQVKVEFLGGVQFRFEKDAADLMLVKDYVPAPHLRAEALPDIECVLCVATHHELARQQVVGLAGLHQHVELSVQDSSDQGNDRHMFGGERVFYLSDFFAKKQAILKGLGYGWMPLYLVDSTLRSGKVREVRYSGGSRYRFTPMLVQRLDRMGGRTGNRLCELLKIAAAAPRTERRVAPAKPRRPSRSARR